ncbi:hypothetical protein AHAS_Ahas11G0268100 [Arachis hypogaea]
MHFLGYKVICVFYGVNSKNQCFQTIIYSSESGVWKHGCSFLPTFPVDFRRATYFKDSIYWNGSKMTLRFDLKEECMKDDMPSLSPEPCHYGYVLAPACDYMNLAGFESGEFSVCVFRLKEDYSSPRWVHKHNIDLRSLIFQTAFDRIGCPYTYRSDDLFSVRYGYLYSIIHLIEDNEDDMGLLIHLMDKVVVLPLTTIVDNNDNHLDANALFKAMSTPFSPLTASTARFMAVLAFSFPSSSAIFTMNLTTPHDMDVKGYVYSNLLYVL